MGKGAQVLSQITGVKECQRAAPLHAHACFSGSHANKNNSTQFINKSGTDGNGCLRKKLKLCCFTEVVQAFSCCVSVYWFVNPHQQTEHFSTTFGFVPSIHLVISPQHSLAEGEANLKGVWLKCLSIKFQWANQICHCITLSMCHEQSVFIYLF